MDCWVISWREHLGAGKAVGTGRVRNCYFSASMLIFFNLAPRANPD